MTPEEFKRLQDERGKLTKQIKDVADRQDKWTAEDEERWKTLNKAYDEVLAKLEAGKAELDALEARQQAVAQRMEQIGQHADAFQLPQNSGGGGQRRIGHDGATLDSPPAHDFAGQQARREAQFALALQGWALNGSRYNGEIRDEHRQAAQTLGIDLAANCFDLRLANTGDFRALQRRSRLPQNALSTFDGPVGGFTVPETFISRLEMAMLAFGGMLRVSEVIRTGTGEVMKWPTFDDTGQTGVQIGEAEGTSAGTDPTIGQTSWNAYIFSSRSLLVSYQLLRDSAFNLAAVIADMLGERLGRIQNTRFTTGTGAATAYGIVTRATAGVTAASATAIAYDELIDLEHSIDPSRRNMPGVGYMFHDNVLLALRKVKDGEGRYLWQAGANSGAPDTLNARPYTVNQDMASSIAASAVTILFGQLSMYKIRQVGTVRLYRLTEKYRDSSDQDAFVAFVEADGNLLDPGDNPVKKLTQAAA